MIKRTIMHLIKSKKAIASNIKELMSTQPSKGRKKAIETYMKRHNCNYDTAKRKIAVAIAFNAK